MKGGRREHAGPRRGEVQTERFRPPDLPAWVFPRPRIGAAVEAAFQRADVVVLVAPSGSGKTVAAQQFSRSLAWPTAWINFDGEDISPTRLVASLAVALGADGERGERIVREGLQASLRPTEVAAELAEHVPPNRLLIVLDDCEEVTRSSDAAAVITSFLTYLPAEARVILLSNTALDPMVRRLRLDGRVGQVEPTVLAFTDDETAGVLVASGRAATAAADLTRATDGWATGVAFGATGPRDGSDDVLGALVDDIVDRLDPLEAALLTRCSLAEQITPAVAARVVGPEGATLLARVARRHLPTTVDLDGNVTCHSGFRRRLQERLEALPQDEVQALLRLHATLRTEGEHHLGAAGLWLQVGDLDAAADAVASALPDLLLQGDWATIITWTDRLAAGLPARPSLVTARIRALTRSRRFGEVHAIVRGFSPAELELLAEADPNVVTDIRWSFIARPVDGLAFTSELPSDHRAEALRFTLRVITSDQRVQPPPGEDFGDVSRLYSWGLFLQGRFDLLEPLHDRLNAIGLDAPPSNPILLTSIWTGRHQLARRIWDQMPRDEQGLTDHIEAWILLAENDLVGARRAAEESLRKSQASNFGWDPCMELAIALTHLRSGSLAEAEVVLDRVTADTEAAGLRAYREWATLYRSLLLLHLDRTADAAAMLERCITSMRESGRRALLPTALAYLSEAKARGGEQSSAEALAAEAVAEAREMGAPFTLAHAVTDLPALADRLPVESAAAMRRDAGRTSTHHVEVQPFGPTPELTVDGSPCGVRRLKVIELAAMLALHGGRVPRRQAQLDLFPEHDLRTGSNYFRQITHQFRRATGVPLVRVDRSTVGLPDGCSITSPDVRLLELTESDDPHELALALGAARGTYLPGSALDWAEGRRFEIDVARSDLGQHAAVLALEHDEAALAVVLAEWALEDDPYSEEAFTVLLAAADRTGAEHNRQIAEQRARAALGEIYGSDAEVDAVLAARLQHL